MPAVVPFIPLIAAGISGGAQALAARSQNRAIQRSTDTQVQGTNYAADKQDEASRRTEQFQRESAQQAWAQQEADRRANYDQWVSRERRLGSIAERLGYGGREIPGYVPSVNPGYVPSQAGGPPSTSMPVNGGPGTPLNSQQIADDQRRRQSEADGYGWGGRRPGQPWDPRIQSAGSGSTPQAMSVRDVMMARRFPQGSVGAMVMARQQRPAGVGV